MTQRNQSAVLSHAADRLLRAREVAGVLGIGLRTLWRLVSCGTLPRPIYIGRCARWLQSEIDAWLEAQRKAPRRRRK